MNRTIGFYNAEMERLLRSVGVDIPRWRVLMLAHERGPLGVSEVAEHAIMKLSTTMRVVQRLRRDGLLLLSHSPADGRVTEVSLAPGGVAVVSQIRLAASKVYNQSVRDFSSAEVNNLNALLKRLQQNLSEHI